MRKLHDCSFRPQNQADAELTPCTCWCHLLSNRFRAVLAVHNDLLHTGVSVEHSKVSKSSLMVFFFSMKSRHDFSFEKLSRTEIEWVQIGPVMVTSKGFSCALFSWGIIRYAENFLSEDFWWPLLQLYRNRQTNNFRTDRFRQVKVFNLVFLAFMQLPKYKFLHKRTNDFGKKSVITERVWVRATKKWAERKDLCQLEKSNYGRKPSAIDPIKSSCSSTSHHWEEARHFDTQTPWPATAQRMKCAEIHTQLEFRRT